MNPLVPIAIGGGLLLALVSGSHAAPGPAPGPHPLPPGPPGPGPSPGPLPPLPAGLGSPPVDAVGWAPVTTHDTGPTGALNVRQGPSTSAPSVGTVPHGGALWITGPMVGAGGGNADFSAINVPGADWYPVTIPNTSVTGFASTAFIGGVSDIPGVTQTNMITGEVLHLPTGLTLQKV